MGLLKILGVKTRNEKLEEFLAEDATILDVRTQKEYNMGHIKGATNVPLDQLEKRVEILKKKNKPIITCCQSGMRSRKAKSILANNGFKVMNGGGWMMLNNRIERIKND